MLNSLCSKRDTFVTRCWWYAGLAKMGRRVMSRGLHVDSRGTFRPGLTRLPPWRVCVLNLACFFLYASDLLPADSTAKAPHASSPYDVYPASTEERAWAVVQARILADGTARGGICGTAWLIRATTSSLVFCTASHIVTTETFASSKDAPISVMVFLVNSQQHSIRIEISSVFSLDGLDLAFISLPNTLGEVFAPLPLGECEAGAAVYNLGFPSSASSSIQIDLAKRAVTLSAGPSIQRGIVTGIVEMEIISIDVNIQGARGYRLSYASETGYSGGPLFSEDSDAVVGMMVASLPKADGNHSFESIALSVAEIVRGFSVYDRTLTDETWVFDDNLTVMDSE